MNLKCGPSPQLGCGWGDQAQSCVTAREQCRVILENYLSIWDIHLMPWKGFVMVNGGGSLWGWRRGANPG